MSQIQVHDKFFKPYIDENTLNERIEAIAAQLSQDYKG